MHTMSRNQIRLFVIPLFVAGLLVLSYIAVAINPLDRWKSAVFRGDQDAAALAPARPDAASAIAFWQQRVEQRPQSAVDHTLLGQALARKARTIGDGSTYQQAEAALRRALELNPQYLPATLSLADVLIALHEFEAARELANMVIDKPRATQAYATIGDAQLALGNYAKAEAAYRTLLERSPDQLALSRMAILADINGDPEQALALMQNAADTARKAGEYRDSLAWYEYQLGELQFKAGRIAAAKTHYQAAHDLSNGSYLSLAALGKVHAAQGGYPAAIDLYEQAVAIVPQPDILAALGDVYAVSGQDELAQQQYATVAYIGKLATINEQTYNRQLARFYTDHDIELERALELARAEIEIRRDIYGYDSAAWAAYKLGQLAEAQTWIEAAMERGTRDASLFYHAGMIAHAQGRNADAAQLLNKALAINPHFDLLQAQIAEATLEELRTQR